jgi:hypothetical protein
MNAVRPGKGHYSAIITAPPGLGEENAARNRMPKLLMPFGPHQLHVQKTPMCRGIESEKLHCPAICSLLLILLAR